MKKTLGIGRISFAFLVVCLASCSVNDGEEQQPLKLDETARQAIVEDHKTYLGLFFKEKGLKLPSNFPSELRTDKRFIHLETGEFENGKVADCGCPILSGAWEFNFDGSDSPQLRAPHLFSNINLGQATWEYLTSARSVPLMGQQLYQQFVVQAGEYPLISVFAHPTQNNDDINAIAKISAFFIYPNGTQVFMGSTSTSLTGNWRYLDVDVSGFNYDQGFPSNGKLLVKIEEDSDEATAYFDYLEVFLYD